jgi:hypothetical protein
VPIWQLGFRHDGAPVILIADDQTRENLAAWCRQAALCRLRDRLQGLEQQAVQLCAGLPLLPAFHGGEGGQRRPIAVMTEAADFARPLPDITHHPAGGNGPDQFPKMLRQPPLRGPQKGPDQRW